MCKKRWRLWPILDDILELSIFGSHSLPTFIKGKTFVFSIDDLPCFDQNDIDRHGKIGIPFWKTYTMKAACLRISAGYLNSISSSASSFRSSWTTTTWAFFIVCLAVLEAGDRVSVLYYSYWFLTPKLTSLTAAVRKSESPFADQQVFSNQLRVGPLVAARYSCFSPSVSCFSSGVGEAMFDEAMIMTAIFGKVVLLVPFLLRVTKSRQVCGVRTSRSLAQSLRHK